MKLEEVLLSRYLLRQRIIILIVFVIVGALITTSVLLLSNDWILPIKISLIVFVILIWALPIYLVFLIIINQKELKEYLKNLNKEKTLYDQMTNEIVRNIVVKNGIKISIYFKNKTDYESFNLLINEEIKFQRKKIELLNKK